MKKYIYDIVLIGNYTQDTISNPSGSRLVHGGGFNYGSWVAIMMGLKVAAITRLAREDKHVVDALEENGVDVFPYFSPSSTLLRLHYPTSNPDERILTVSGVADPFLPEHVAGIESRAFLLNATARGEITLDVIREIRKKDAMIVADLQGFVRVIGPDGIMRFEPWEGKKDVLPLVDILKSDSVEGESLTGEKDRRKQAKILSGFGPREIVITHRDGVLVFAEGEYHEVPFSYEKLVGRSGRGDTCISSYVCKRLSASVHESAVWSAAVTSMKMEADGPIKRTVKEVEEHIRKHYK
jgi:sugar/nucleoside kinase (ribokinase family)